ncbi:glutathione peroxidase [Engelhardtia mirabilis]|uniref:Glutathione peroxidase n=1 Tax=Engelhardtia mirabilis TaxID=2528011 RepID=A0A518BF45_9BACT|nr:Hydroperoxy fatty acid reductase gpx1 [Planctomycetes bacterium Pla133]QDU99935.1 Hydroperoxy fatty acid reductase gpx1 [Planctomycetes bacterium Pla86]
MPTQPKPRPLARLAGPLIAGLLVASCSGFFRDKTEVDQSAAEESLYSLSAESLAGQPAPLSAWDGQVTLVVNVASKCGFTPQYEGLQELQETYGERGFSVLAFPSNDFGGQEPGTADEIQTFCAQNYAVTFPLFAKVATKGDDQSPVYAHLGGATGTLPGWNFCKYLVGRDGQVIAFYDSRTKPTADELTEAIEAALAG